MKQSILVSLDSILDTRFATLIKLNETLAVEVIKAGYRKRSSDLWSDLNITCDQNKYNELYQERDGKTLELARPTNIIPILNHMTNELGEAKISLPFIEDISLTVNMYPYRFTEEVETDILNAIRTLLSIDCIVRSVFMKPLHLMPNVLADNYDAVIMYEFNEWLSIHGEALQRQKIPTVRIIAPAIYAKGKPSDHDLSKQGSMSPFEELEYTLSEFVSLNLIDIGYFSLTDVKA